MKDNDERMRMLNAKMANHEQDVIVGILKNAGMVSADVTIIEGEQIEFGGVDMAGSEKGRVIEAYKGGRDSRLPTGRVTKSERERIDSVLEKSNESFTDWVIRHVINDEKEKRK